MPRETSGGESSFLATRRGQLTLALVCLAGFLDFLDVTIVNVALPSIRDDLEFSFQDLQRVTGGYLVTYGGFLLLGGRAADLLGRRRLLVAGTSLFGHGDRHLTDPGPARGGSLPAGRSNRWLRAGLHRLQHLPSRGTAIAARATNTRGQPAQQPTTTPEVTEHA
jgi:hypothetical protein